MTATQNAQEALDAYRAAPAMHNYYAEKMAKALEEILREQATLEAKNARLQERVSDAGWARDNAAQEAYERQGRETW